MSENMRHGTAAGAPIELAFPLPKARQTKIHMRLTISETSILLLLTTIHQGETSAKPALGSFVYALPNRINPGQTLCTNIFTYESSVDLAIRMSRLLARKTRRPVYVGNSMSFASTGMGGTVEEEMEGFKKVVEVVMEEVQRFDNDPVHNGQTGGST